MGGKPGGSGSGQQGEDGTSMATGVYFLTNHHTGKKAVDCGTVFPNVALHGMQAPPEAMNKDDETKEQSLAFVGDCSLGDKSLGDLEHSLPCEEFQERALRTQGGVRERERMRGLSRGHLRLPGATWRFFLTSHENLKQSSREKSRFREWNLNYLFQSPS